MFWYLIVINASIKKIVLHCDCARAAKFPERVKGPQHSSISVVKRNVSEIKRFVQTLRMCFTDANRKTKRISVLSVVISDSAYKILHLQYQGP